MNSSVKKKAEKFIRENHLQTVTLDNLSAAIRRMGYTIVEYSDVCSKKNVAELLAALDLEKFAGQTRGFTYADSRMRVVFIHEDLSREEKTIVLAHEAGHICCNHLGASPVIGREVLEEYEASEFAHCLLNPGMGRRLGQAVKKHRKGLIAAAAALILLIGGGAVWLGIRNSQKYYGEYYITENGDRYHRKDCRFIRNNKNVSRLTVEQYESGKYGPCEFCLPQNGEENGK